MHRILFTLLLLILLFTSLGSGELVQAWQEPANLLQNPGFEGDYYAWFGLNTAQVAHGWTPWWRPRAEGDPPSFYFQPEYKQANGYIYPNRVRSGAAAQQWFTFHSTHLAGMYQQVFGVTPGIRYRFNVWAQVWSSTEDDSSVSVNPAYPNLQIGIDPTGNWDPFASTVIWSGTYAFFDTWGQLAVEAVAQNDVITVFMRSKPNFPVKHNDMYWDDAMLTAVGEGGEPVPSTATPVAPPPSTATPAAPPPPTPTCAPAPPDWVTYYVRPGDTLFRLAMSSGTTLEKVISVNCLDSSTIYVGQALLLPKLPVSATPSGEKETATPVPATATPSSTETPLPTALLTPTETPEAPTSTTVPATPTASPIPPSPTAVPSTETPIPVAAATATPTKPRPTIPPPATATPGSPIPPPTSTPLGESTRPCGTIAVGAGFVIMAGAFRFRRRRRLEKA